MSLSELYRSNTSISDPKPSAGQTVRRSRLRLSSWMLPVLLVIAFAGLFGYLFKDNLIPSLPVKVTRAVLLADLATGGESPSATANDQLSAELSQPEVPQTSDESEGERAEGAELLPDFSAAMLFQAAGWLEPDPLPIRATALTDGVVEKVHVLEGQVVRKGQPLADLISEDAELTHRSAIRSREAIVAEHHMHLAQIPSREAEAEAFLDQARAAEAELAKLIDTEERLKKLSSGTVSELELTSARLAVEAKRADIDALSSQHKGALAKLKAIEAQSAVFEAKIAEAEVIEAEKKLALERTKITSPVDGVVLELKAAPGQKKMLGMDDMDSATIAVLFETGKLQARVDVPLADARGLVQGQGAIVTTDFLPDVEFEGIVTRIVGVADLQRNTLQAKVRVIDPDDRLRPEMLCRVKFLDSVIGEAKPGPDGGNVRKGSAGQGGRGENRETRKGQGGKGRGDRAIFVLEEALVGGGAGGAGETFAWVIDSSGNHAERRMVELGGLRRGNYVSVDSGILAGEQLILPPHDSLSEGRRVRIEDDEED